MTTLLLSDDAKKAKARYTAIKLQIDEKKNLHALLREVDEAISNVDELIVKAIVNGSPHSGLDALRNELWQLNFQILERTE